MFLYLEHQLRAVTHLSPLRFLGRRLADLTIRSFLFFWFGLVKDHSTQPLTTTPFHHPITIPWPRAAQRTFRGQAHLHFCFCNPFSPHLPGIRACSAFRFLPYHLLQFSNRKTRGANGKCNAAVKMPFVMARQAIR